MQDGNHAGPADAEAERAYVCGLHKSAVGRGGGARANCEQISEYRSHFFHLRSYGLRVRKRTPQADRRSCQGTQPGVR